MRPYGEKTDKGVCWDTRWPRRTRRTYSGRWRDRISTETHRNERRLVKKRARQDGKRRTKEDSEPG